METEIKKEPRRNISLRILIAVVLVFVIYYSVMSALGPSRKLEQIKKKEYGAKASEKKDSDSGTSKDSAYLKLLKEKSFLQSRVVMAQTDSIYLTVNLYDSTANLEISGVAVHKAKLTGMKASKILEGNDNAILSMLSAPFTISHTLATIKKDPVMIKIAPKDTSEYKPDIMPDTSITEPVNYILETNQGVRIYVYQQENAKMQDRISQYRFDLNDRLKDTWSALKKVAVFKVPEYHPFIRIKLPRSDAKIIYRAIPKNGQIAFFY